MKKFDEAGSGTAKIRKIAACVLAVISLAIILYAAPRLHRDNTIRQNGETFSTEVLGMSGRIPWVYLHISPPEGVEVADSSDIYRLRVMRNLLQWGQYASWSPFHLIGETVDVIRYNDTLLYAGNPQRDTYTTNLVFATFFMMGAAWLFFAGRKPKIRGTDENLVNHA